ncbi:MAG: PIN domain-containing protein [Candidatus Hodarchaeales archaeon]|jgi:predicted nucleic acid-binding protein
MAKKPLNFTDCTILAYMESEKIDFLVTFDTEFDSLANIVRI